MVRYIDKLAVVGMAISLAACATLKYPEVGVDPTLTWDPVTTNCVGETFTGSATYNVYILQGPGPFPTVQTPDEIPCGVMTLIDNSAIQPANASPLTVTTYKAIVGEGVWSFAVESISPGGSRGGFTSVTRTVKNRAKGSPAVNVGP